MVEVFFSYIGYTILFLPFTWVVYLLNTFFSFYWSAWGTISFILASNTLFIWQFTRCTCSMSRHTRRTWIVFANIYFFEVLYFGGFIIKTGWWNRPRFIQCFSVSSVSVFLVDLDLFNNLDLSNDLPFYNSLLMDLSFLLLDSFGLSVSLTVWILFFAMGGVMASSIILGFFRFNSSFFDHFVCSSDQWLFGRHDLGDWYSLLVFATKPK